MILRLHLERMRLSLGGAIFLSALCSLTFDLMNLESSPPLELLAGTIGFVAAYLLLCISEEPSRVQECLTQAEGSPSSENEFSIEEATDHTNDPRLESILVAHSQEQQHGFIYEPFCLQARGPDGVYLGGLYGYTIQGRFSLEELAVEAHARGRGIGKALMKRLEDTMKVRGVQSIYLGTWDFQAPAFYEALGYKAFGKLPDVAGFPGKSWYEKQLPSS